MKDDNNDDDYEISIPNPGFTPEEMIVFTAVIKALYKVDAPPDHCYVPLMDLLVMTAQSLDLDKRKFLISVSVLWDSIEDETKVNDLLDKVPVKKDFNVN